MLKLLIALLSIVFNVSSFAETVTCGEAKGELIFKKVKIDGYDEIEATISASLAGKTVQYKVKDADFVGLDCTKNKDGKPMFIFQAYCGGTACRDLDNYGLIDPSSLKIPLTPNGDDKAIVKNMLGLEPAPIKKIVSINKMEEDLFRRGEKRH